MQRFLSKIRTRIRTSHKAIVANHNKFAPILAALIKTKKMDLHERLCTLAAEKNWNNLVDLVKPKHFGPDNEKTSDVKKSLAKLAEILITSNAKISADVRIVLLKSLANSCVKGFKHKEYLPGCDTACEPNAASSERSDVTDQNTQYFSYAAVVAWCTDYIAKCHENLENCSEEQRKTLQFCVQFLVNFTVLACDIEDLPDCLKSVAFKWAIVSLVGSPYLPLAIAACRYICNQFTRIKLPQDYYTEAELCGLALPLIKADKMGIDSARDSLIFLMKKPGWLKKIYDDLSIDDKLDLLNIILEDARKTVYSDSTSQESTNFTSETIEFLSERFKKRSDLILKTVDSYLDGTEPVEVTLLLDIIGIISSKDSLECQMLQSDKSLMINCIFLLKSLHMTGKTSKNYFTPLQKLSDVAPNSQESSGVEFENDFQSHPAFGFKAGLIRAIGNLAHRHKINQELLRETETIPLLLDCCNIDARNPLIMQWTIFALRNACEKCPENQEIIRDCNKIGVVDNAVLREMGMKLHEDEDGKSIGILPLSKNK